jgi:hypothetical protein
MYPLKLVICSLFDRKAAFSLLEVRPTPGFRDLAFALPLYPNFEPSSCPMPDE